VDIDRLTLEEKQAFKKISTWDYVNDANQIAPTVFDIWQKRLHAAIWSDEFGGNGSYRFPSSARTIQLIMDEPNAPWFDNIHTENKESLQQLVNSSFKDTVTELTKQLGEMGNQWRWGKFKGVDIAHLGRLPGFGKMGLNVGGGLGIVNAIGKTSGPSWRMVVSLEPEVKAWGVYPGGQSGNPGSSYYDNFVDAWMEGELDELLFLKSMDTTHYRIQSVIILEAGK
jgi:penicillin amidase